MGGTPVTQAPAQATGLTLAQIQQQGGTPVSQTKDKGAFLHPLDALSNQYNNAVTTAKEGVTSGSQEIQKGNLIHGQAEAGLGVASAGVGALFAPFSASADAIIPQGNSELGKFASDTAKGAVVGAELGTIVPGAGTLIGGGIGALFGAGLHVVNAVKDAIFTHTNISEPDKAMINNALNVGLAVIGEKVGSAKTEGTGLNTPVSEITPTTMKDNLPSLPKPTPEEVAAKNATQMKKNLQGVADDWAKPTTINEPKYNNARTVLEKDPEVTKTLAQNGVNPFSHVEDGKYNTEDTAQRLRDDNGKLSRDLLRPSLQQADYTVPPTPTVELKPTIDDSYGVTADDAEAIQHKLTTKMDALSRKYPNGMSLTDLLDEKIIYDKNGGYKAFKSNADNIDAIANRAIADSMRDTLGIKGEAAGIPVNAFQAELAKNYRAAEYLDALHGKKAPVSIGQSIVRYGAKVIGAKTAGMLGGGDLVNEFVGYHIGGALEKFVENMTNPMRDSFLQNLKVTNPKAFTQIEQFLGKAEATRATTLKLSTGTPLGTDGNPIITPAPTTYEAPAKVVDNNTIRQTLVDKAKEINQSDTTNAKIIQETLAGKREDFRLDNMKQLERAKNYGSIPKNATPETEIEIWRVGTGDIKNGDFITTSKKNAQRLLAKRPGAKMYKSTSQVGDLVLSMGKGDEFIFNPPQYEPYEVLNTIK